MQQHARCESKDGISCSIDVFPCSRKWRWYVAVWYPRNAKSNMLDPQTQFRSQPTRGYKCFLGTTNPLLSAGRSFLSAYPQTLSFIRVIVKHKLHVSSEWPVVFFFPCCYFCCIYLPSRSRWWDTLAQLLNFPPAELTHVRFEAGTCLFGSTYASPAVAIWRLELLLCSWKVHPVANRGLNDGHTGPP